MEPWNSTSTVQPPVNTTMCLNNNIDVKDLRHAFNNIRKILSKQAPLHNESAILSRFLYKYDKKFRSDIGYKRFKMVSSALKKYLALNLLKDIVIFLELLPEINEKNLYLPTRQMLEYVLVRIMTFAKLMSRIIICSKQSAVFYLNRIKRSESHWMSLMPYALLSRIWSMSLVLLQHSCNWYNRLHAFLPSLVHKGLPFLTDQFILPDDLEIWINIKNLNEEGRFNWAQKSTVDTDAIVMENEEGDLCENLLMYVDKINSSTKKCEPDMQLLDVKSQKDDLGEKISRENFYHIMNDTFHSALIQKTDIKHSIANVMNIQTLLTFLSDEEKYRNEASDLSLTSHLSFMQWQSLKLALHKLDNGLIRNRKLQMKVQKIWKDKCLDYL